MVGSGRVASRASIFVLAPTVLHLMGHTVYQELEGRVLTELLVEPGSVSMRSESLETPRPAELRWLEDESWSDPQLDEVRARLNRTGYAEAR